MLLNEQRDQIASLSSTPMSKSTKVLNIAGRKFLFLVTLRICDAQSYCVGIISNVTTCFFSGNC